MKLVLLVRYTSQNLVKYFLFVHEILLAVREPWSPIIYLHNWQGLHLTLILPLTILTFYRHPSRVLLTWKTFSHNSRLLSRFPMGSPGVPTPPGFLFCSLHRWCPHLLKRQQRRIQAFFRSNTNQTPTFWRPRSTLSPNNRTKMCPFSTGHSVTLQEGPIPTMMHAMNPSSRIVSRAGGGRGVGPHVLR